MSIEQIEQIEQSERIGQAGAPPASATQGQATVINVSNRLPVTIDGGIKKSSGGLVAALESLKSDQYALRWIGWPGGIIREDERKREIEKTLAESYGFTPVFLTRKEAAAYYHGFSNSSLWPLMHYMANYMAYDERWWEIYEDVNRKFADKILEVAGEDDLIWVHDYHLMLLPAMLRQARPRLKVGFFFHTPFPSYEVFRCHPKCSELIEGLLGADQIGFHTFGYLRHFRSTVLRLLGLESEINSIPQGSRQTMLGVYPIGINTEKFLAELKSDALREKKEAYRKNFNGKKIVLSVDRLDYTKGVLHRLKAIEDFLESSPDRDGVVFVFVSVPSRGEVPEYQELLEQVERQVGKVNGKYATIENNPIHFIHRSVHFTELCALYSVADVALVTPLMDGMNLVAKEYVVCQEDHPGTLILSEFAGAAQELFDATIVNPYDNGAVAESLREAFDLTEEDKRGRMARMRSRVLQYDAAHWAKSFIDALAARSTAEESPLESDQAIGEIIERVAKAKRIACFLDYDGTLRELVDNPGRAAPHERVLQALARFRNFPSFDVFVISGRNSDQLDTWLGRFPFTLIAEHGGGYRPFPGKVWKDLHPHADLSWKARVLDILRYYEGSTPGSSIEDKRSAVVWHYRRADPEFGQWKANVLMGELFEMLANIPVQIHHGKKIVEISSMHVNKGAAVEHFVDQKDYDLALCAGDDQTDESMFRVQHENMISIKVGEGDTHAQYRLDSPEAFRDFLHSMMDACETPT